MNIFLDCLVVVLVCFFVLDGYKKGLVRSFVEILGAILSFVLALILSPYIVQFIYDIFLKTSLTNTVSSILAQNTGIEPDQKAFEILKAVPAFISNSINSYGVTVESLTSAISAKDPANTIVDLLSPVVLNIIRVFILYPLFIIFFFISKLAAKKLSNIVHIPILGKLNSILGAVIGLFKGILILLIISGVIKFVLNGYYNAPDFLSNETISQTVIFRNIYNFNFDIIKKM